MGVLKEIVGVFAEFFYRNRGAIYGLLYGGELTVVWRLLRNWVDHHCSQFFTVNLFWSFSDINFYCDDDLYYLNWVISSITHDEGRWRANDKF